MLEQKQDVHSLRYRVTDRKGYSMWVHCRGIVKGPRTASVPLFFSRLCGAFESDFSLDAVTGFLGEQAALNEPRHVGE